VPSAFRLCPQANLGDIFVLHFASGSCIPLQRRGQQQANEFSLDIGTGSNARPRFFSFNKKCAQSLIKGARSNSAVEGSFHHAVSRSLAKVAQGCAEGFSFMNKSTSVGVRSDIVANLLCSCNSKAIFDFV
jgi:hypothetical protein